METTTITTVPVYLDWTFWAVIVALLAIVLSQLPPIHILLRNARLDLEVYSKISITHKLGNPNLQLHLILNNIGGRKIRVRDINVRITRDGQDLTQLPAQNYLQNQNDQNTILFTSFSLQPGDEWAHITNFLNFFNRDDERAYQEIENGMHSYFREIRAEEDREKDDLVEFPPELVEPAERFFENHFCWKPGEYSMQVNVISDNESANLSKTYRFTVFESHTNTLTAIRDHFKYGGGLWWNPKIQTSVILELNEA